MMNCSKSNCVKRCLIPAIAAFIFIFLFDWIFHGMLLMPLYEATSSVWRPQAEAQQLMPWMFFHQLALAVLFTCLFKKTCSVKVTACTSTPDASQNENKKCCPYKRGICFGATIGLIVGVIHSMSYVWLPIPMTLALAWLAGSVTQGIGIGLILSLLHQKLQPKDNA